MHAHIILRLVTLDSEGLSRKPCLSFQLAIPPSLVVSMHSATTPCNSHTHAGPPCDQKHTWSPKSILPHPLLSRILVLIASKVDCLLKSENSTHYPSSSPKPTTPLGHIHTRSFDVGPEHTCMVPKEPIRNIPQPPSSPYRLRKCATTILTT